MDDRGVAYTMLHGLSHAVMAEIALECGYPASALKERIYALWDPARLGATGRFGILIYTATAGNQGTLGGSGGNRQAFRPHHPLGAAAS